MGKWQKRVLQTLQEAGHPLTIRQLNIRIGAGYISDSFVRNTLSAMVKQGLIERADRGLYQLSPLTSRRFTPR